MVARNRNALVVLALVSLTVSSDQSCWAFFQPSSQGASNRNERNQKPVSGLKILRQTMGGPLAGQADNIPGMGGGVDEVSMRTLYDNWRKTHKKGGSFDQRRYETFKSNYLASKAQHEAATLRARQESRPSPGPLQLNQFADLSAEEFKAVRQHLLARKKAEFENGPNAADNNALNRLKSDGSHRPPPSVIVGAYAEKHRQLEESPGLGVSPSVAVGSAARLKTQQWRRQPLGQSGTNDSPSKMANGSEAHPLQANDDDSGFPVDIRCLEHDVSMTQRDRIRIVYSEYCSHFGKKMNERRLDIFAKRLLTLLQVQQRDQWKAANRDPVRLNAYADLSMEEFQVVKARQARQVELRSATKLTSYRETKQSKVEQPTPSRGDEQAVIEEALKPNETGDDKEEKLVTASDGQSKDNNIVEDKDDQRNGTVADQELFQRALLQEKLRNDSREAWISDVSGEREPDLTAEKEVVQRSLLSARIKNDAKQNRALSLSDGVPDDTIEEAMTDDKINYGTETELFHRSMLQARVLNDSWRSKEDNQTAPDAKERAISKQEHENLKPLKSEKKEVDVLAAAAARQRAWEAAKGRAATLEKKSGGAVSSAEKPSTKTTSKQDSEVNSKSIPKEMPSSETKDITQSQKVEESMILKKTDKVESDEDEIAEGSRSRDLVHMDAAREQEVRVAKAEKRRFEEERLRLQAEVRLHKEEEARQKALDLANRKAQEVVESKREAEASKWKAEQEILRREETEARINHETNARMEAEAALLQAEEEVKELDAKRKAERAARRRAETKVRRKSKEVSVLQEKEGTLRSEIEAAQKETDRVRQEAEAQDALRASEIESLKEEGRKLHNQLESQLQIESIAANKSEEVSRLEEEVSRLREEAEAARREADTARTATELQITKSEEQIEALKQKEARLLVDTKSKAESEAEALRIANEFMILRDQEAELRVQAEKRQQDAESEVDRRLSEIAKLKKDEARLQVQLKEAKQAEERAKEDAKREANRREIMLQALRDKEARYRTESELAEKEAETKILKLKSEMEEREDNYVSLKNEELRLSEEIEAVKREAKLESELKAQEFEDQIAEETQRRREAEVASQKAKDEAAGQREALKMLEDQIAREVAKAKLEAEQEAQRVIKIEMKRLAEKERRLEEERYQQTDIPNIKEIESPKKDSVGSIQDKELFQRSLLIARLQNTEFAAKSSVRSRKDPLMSEKASASSTTSPLETLVEDLDLVLSELLEVSPETSGESGTVSGDLVAEKVDLASTSVGNESKSEFLDFPKNAGDKHEETLVSTPQDTPESTGDLGADKAILKEGKSSASSQSDLIADMLSQEFQQEELDELATLLPELGVLINPGGDEMPRGDSGKPFFATRVASTTKSEQVPRKEERLPQFELSLSETATKIANMVDSLSETMTRFSKSRKFEESKDKPASPRVKKGDYKSAKDLDEKDTVEKPSKPSNIDKDDHSKVVLEKNAEDKIAKDENSDDTMQAVDEKLSVLSRLSSLIGDIAGEGKGFGDSKGFSPRFYEADSKLSRKQQKPKVPDYEPQDEIRNARLEKSDFPLLRSWIMNTDGSITGSVSNSEYFENGSEITIAPVESTSNSGEVVTTVSGSRYLLIGEGEVVEPGSSSDDSFKDDSSLMLAPGYGFESDLSDESDASKAEAENMAQSIKSLFKKSPKITPVNKNSSNENTKTDVVPPADESKGKSPIPFIMHFGSRNTKETEVAESSLIEGQTDSSLKQKKGLSFGNAFGRGAAAKEADQAKSEESKLKAKKNKKRGRRGKSVAVISDWEQNDDKSITGMVTNSENFEDGTYITTSPLRNSAKAGRIVRTTGGTRYKLT